MLVGVALLWLTAPEKSFSTPERRPLEAAEGRTRQRHLDDRERRGDARPRRAGDRRHTAGDLVTAAYPESERDPHRCALGDALIDFLLARALGAVPPRRGRAPHRPDRPQPPIA